MPGGGSRDPRGKLRTVATRWAGGRGGGPPADDAATGAAAGAIAAIEARRRAGRRDGDAVEIGPDEAEPASLFLALGSQWRLHAFSGVRLGIDYAAVPPVAAMLGIEMTPSLFQDLRVMEDAALAAFAAAR